MDLLYNAKFEFLSFLTKEVFHYLPPGGERVRGAFKSTVPLAESNADMWSFQFTVVQSYYNMPTTLNCVRFSCPQKCCLHHCLSLFRAKNL